MSEELEVRWRAARAWLESVRRASAAIEAALREIAALEDARARMFGWRTAAGGAGGHGMGAHSDPTADAAERRMCELDDLIAAKRADYGCLVETVGACGTALDAMAASLGERHAEALELYYLDLADTWSDVACEMGLTRQRVWQLRSEAYAWIEGNCRGILA